MMDNAIKNVLWLERYRPKTLQECILPQRIKDELKQYVQGGNIINYSAVGLSGSGKTSSAKAICEELGLDYLLINMSNENGIDTVRNKIVNFASTQSMTSDYKVIILDEFDYANANSTQPALRGVIEQFQDNCRFIVTANHKTRIIDAIYSRCPIVDFNFTKDEKKEMIKEFQNRIIGILKENEVAFDTREVTKFVISKFPDFRSTINEVQRSIRNNELFLNELGITAQDKTDELFRFLKNKDFDSMRKWVVDNTSSNDGHLIRRAIYKHLPNYINKEDIPRAVLLINEYDFKEAHVIDREVNMVAFLCDFMLNIEIKNV